MNPKMDPKLSPAQDLGIELQKTIFKHFLNPTTKICAIDTLQLAKALGMIAGYCLGSLKQSSFENGLAQIKASAIACREEVRKNPEARHEVIEIPDYPN